MTTQVMYSSLDKKGSFPLSFQQERMWFLEQVKPENYAYHIRVAIEMIGLLNVNILEQSINEIVRRHEILRTTFNIIDGQPRQIISSPFRVELPVVDLQKLTATEREQEAKRLTTQIVLSPFNLNTGPLWRVSLLQMESARHIMVLSMHNIVCDGDRSIGIFFREITALYEAFSSGEASSLVELPIQYKEFALRQRQQLQEEILKTQLSYWKQQLGDHLPVLQLPIDHPRRPAIGTYSGAYQDLKLSGDLSEKLKRLSQQQGVTLFVTLLAAFKTLLYRYTRLEDILVGSPVSGRNLPVTEELIGNFGNHLALRTDMSGNPSFLQLLSRVAQVKSQADNHQDYPFQKLVEELKLERDRSFPSLFQVFFILRSDFLPTLLLPNLTLTPLDIESTFLPLDLCISINDTRQGLVWRWEYNTDLFEGATINRIIKHFQNLLCRIVANPEGHIGELPLLTQVERHQLLVEWNNTKTEYASPLIHKLVEAQVAQNSNAVAVVAENQQLTYKELNCRANQLANYLQKLLIKPEGLVGICIERSLLQMVAILGVLKAGGAYVPLDPAYPQERLAYMLSDANVQVLLTTETLLKASSKIAEIAKNQEIVCLDSEWEKISLESDENSVSLVKPDNLAYVIYTSGSTGKPKGVMMEHLALANLIGWHLHNRTVGARTLQFAPLSFDISFHEIFSTWCSGGTLVLIKEEVRLLPEALLNAIAQNKISKLYLPFVALQQLAEVINEQTVPTTLREVMTAGEQLQITPAIANFFRQTGCTLHNHYGATECQDVTTFTLTGDANSWQTLPPIGRPINNTQAYILDEFYQPVPIGVAGELYIGGFGLARGYFNRPDLTKERFIPNPLGSGRLYKTGDLARYRTDGNIEHLGRADRQVKIRGFRIELGEIEGLLAKHPTVQQSAVIAREDVPGNKRLIAYVVPVQFEVAPQWSLALRSYLKEHLPDYMVPNSIVMLDKMPLTPSGKVDRRALPEPEKSRPEWAGALVMPQSDTEKLIARVWQEMLQLEEVGIYDNFFELGGNSLLLIQVHKKLIEILGVGLPTVALFQHPTLHGLAQHLQQTQIEKSTVKLLHQGNNLPLVRVSRIQNLPLSFAQEQMWFLSQLEPTNPFYNEIEALRLLGSVNIVALQQSLNKIIQRHEALRTNFKTVDGQLFQAIAESLTLTVPIVDLEYLPEDDREIAAQQLATAQAQQPFDLASDPLIQVTLFKLREAEYVLLLKIHHIIWDGWSMDVFVQELAAFYSAECNDLSLELPQLPIQYADFAVWQRLQGVGANGETALKEGLPPQGTANPKGRSPLLAYWKQQLEGAPALLELPTDRVRPSTQTFRGARQRVALSFQQREALSSLSQRLGVTLFMTLLAAFQILLSRYTGQTDICVGTVHANRDRPFVRGLIGYFVNTLVLRTDLSGNPSFEDALSRVRDVALGAYAHVDLPFEKLVEELQPARDLSYTPLVQVMLAFNESPQVEMSGLTVSSFFVETATAKFDLTLFLENSASGLIGTWEYNTDLFDADAIARMAGHFQTLLAAIVADPKQGIRELPLLTDAQRHQLLVEWNDTQTWYPQNKCIHQLFEAQVERNSNAVAVVFLEQQLTYGELNTKANQLAYHLQTLGVGPEVLVGLCVERSIEMVVGMLGILKAGGAYVPLDPAYPSERLAFMLSDACVSVLLTQKQLVERLPNHHAKIVCLDGEWENSADGCVKQYINPSNGVTINNLVYVIYTSGSTGQPKGVMVPHRGLLNLVFWHQQAFGVSPLYRATQIAGVGFDACGWEIWPYLTAGASIYFPDCETRLDPEKLLNWLVSKAITISFLPTPLLEKVLQLDWPQEVALRILLTGGDQLHQYPNGAHPFVLVNNYGPTENTVVTTSGLVSCQEQTELLPTIGRPIANTQVYVLDSQMQPLPIGVPGELYISGDGLARGYLNRPELTAEKFIPNPFSEEEGTRLYKTGDRARYLPTGNIEYLGRLDNQVKIRGFRIELGEIEAKLGEYPAVQQTLVMAREDVPGDKRLVAYVVVTQQVPPSPSELRGFLQDKLPEYMVPTAFVLMDAMPLTPNGKIDRRALRAPKTVSSELEQTFAAPTTPIEEILANIWAEVLIKQVGVDDNFFEHGGHSLLATQIISRIRTNLAVEIPLRDLFKNPTVSTLAQCIETALQSGSSSAGLPLLPIGRPEALPLSFAQARIWFLDQLEPGNAFYNIPVAVRLCGRLDIAALQQSLNDLISRHEVLRTNFAIQDGQPVQVIAKSLSLPLPVVDLQALGETEREMTCHSLVTKEALRGFDLGAETLVRAKLFQLQQQEYVLLLVMHHIIFDGWSMGVLVRELAALYEGYCTNQPAVLPQLPIQYADFAYWQQQWLQQGGHESQLAYWKQQLKGANFVLELPTDRPRRAQQTFRGAQQSITLSSQLSESLVTLSQKEGVTLFMTLLAAFQTLLWRYTDQDDICVGTPIANRNRAEIEGLIGFFVNTLVLRTHLGGNPSFRQLLSQVREVAVGAYVHQDLPFEHLVEQLQPERDLSRHPIFQVWFNLLPKGDIPLELSGLDVEPIFMEEAASKFDLTLYVAEQKQAIQLKLVYNTDLFNADTIARMLLHYQTLLEGVVANPEERISTLPLLTETERYYLKSRGNVVSPTNRFITFGKQDIEQSIPVRFEQQVRKYPQNIAVHTNNYNWTYSELNCRANRVAQAILFQCTSSEEKIALLFEHDAPMIAGILGVLKVGKTYVPLDPNYPSDRVVYILEDSLASAVITNNKNLARAQELTRGTIPLINIDEISFPGSDDEIALEISPDTVAYILYTSGSTGQPKGVIQNHRNVLHFIRNYTNNLHINEQDGLTLLSSYSFDAAIMDIFAAILNGATLYPINIKESGLTDLYQWLQQHHITIYHSTPTLYRHFVSTLSGDEKLTQIRLVVLGGEEVVKTDVDLYKEHFSNECIFVNGLGPTESTVTLQYFINKQTEITRHTVPVGYSVDETEILLLNEAGEKTDIYGEIAIRSPYIALGYWRKPDLTQLVFKSDRSGDSRRIYRTGDLGRLRPDGSIEFLGRKDFQVKIRGFRIELGEIEAALSQHPSVRENVVIAREDVPGNKHLVAYVVPTQTLTSDELRNFLKQKLPDYMVPSAFVMLEALPLTPNGKVDRLTLPVPSKSSSLDNFVPPRDKLELQLTQIWSEVLKVDKVGVRNNFFDLGGHSLLAVRLMAKIQQQFGKNLPFAALFQSPTVEELANILQRDSDSSYWSALVAIQPNGSKRPFFCVPGIGANVIYFYDLARHLGTDQPFYGLQALGLDGESPPHTSIEEMAAYYIEAIQTQEPQGPYLLGGHSFGGIVAFEMAIQLHKKGYEVALLAIIDVVAPILSKKSIGVDLDDADCLTNFASFIEYTFSLNLEVSKQTLASLTPVEQLHYLKEQLIRVNLLPQEAGIKSVRGLVQVYKANYQAHRIYLPQQVLLSRIALFRASEVNLLEGAVEDEERVKMLKEPTFGWNKFSSIRSIHVVPGNHMTMMHSPHVQVLAAQLRASLKQAQAHSADSLP